MYLRRFSIRNVRSIASFEMEFPHAPAAGWHVVLGSNGAGKSSVVRSFALLMMGEKEAYASRQDVSRWVRGDQEESGISGRLTFDRSFDSLSGGGYPPERPIQATVTLRRAGTQLGPIVEADYSGERTTRTIWGGGPGWFSASFGPFRRFTGGDRIYDRLFVSNKRLAPHLTALGEDVALTEALGWLTALHVQQLQDERSERNSNAAEMLRLVTSFLNEGGFLPHGARIEDTTNDQVFIRDGNSARIPLDQMSDGYRSALSLTIELVRQMFELYGFDTMRAALAQVPGCVMAPGVVAIDEVDAHLHPTWQRDIGFWLTRHFPRVQFIVTTHSPIVCRAIVDDDGEIRGSVWQLPAPGSGDRFRRVTGADLDLLAFGDVLDAFGTELFGGDVMRSEAGRKKLTRLAALNRIALDRKLTGSEVEERQSLRSALPAAAGRLE